MALKDVLPESFAGDHLAGVSFDELAATYGTPLYIVDEAHLKNRLERFTMAFGRETVRAYAAKAFFCVAMAELLSETDWWVDVVSAGELATALRGGIDPSRIIVHGNVKTDAEIDGAIGAGVGRLVIDDPAEMARVVDIANGRPVDVMLRLNIDVGADTHPKIRTTGSDAHFGMTIDQADQAIGGLATRVQLVGVHIHIGSQLRDPRVHLEALRSVMEFVEERRASFDTEVIDIDIGGGFAVPYVSSDSVSPIDEFGTLLTHARSLYPRIRLMIEPGRSVVANAGVTLYRTISRKGDDRPFLAVDGGISDNPRPALYGASYEMRSVTNHDRDHDTPFRVVGRHCETSDRLGEMQLPAKTRPGDLLVMPATGAYAYSMSSRYNLLPRRPVVFVQDGTHRLAVAGETPSDLIR